MGRYLPLFISILFIFIGLYVIFFTNKVINNVVGSHKSAGIGFTEGLHKNIVSKLLYKLLGLVFFLAGMAGAYSQCIEIFNLPNIF